MRDCCKTNGFYLIDDITKEKTKEQEHIKKLDKPQGKDLLAREEVSCRNLINAKEKAEEQEHIKTMNKSQKKDTLAWEEVSCEHLIQDEWMDLRKSAYRFPDGNIFAPYYSYSRRDYVVVVASDCNGNYICVRQFRHGIKEVTTEFPAGGIDRRDAKEYDISKELAFLAAKRELLEETGYESDEWEHLLTIPSDATICDNYGYLYRAKNCRKVSGQELDETEFVEVITLSFDQIEDLIRKGKFQQAMHITAWLLAQRNK
jgi:NUDIX domain